LSYLTILVVAFLASALTFFSGFGLGTLLLPAFALFFAIELAVALTAVVHFLNGLFKLALVGRHADPATVLRFGVPALVASLAGAWVLGWLADAEPLVVYPLLGRMVRLTPAKLVVGLLLLVFAIAELIPRSRDTSFGPKLLPLGGALSGFFGGLAGMQGALRSAFLARTGLGKEAFVASGVVVACMIDVSRLGVYARSLMSEALRIDYWLLTGAVLSAFAGSVAGNRFLKVTTMSGVRVVVAAMLLFVALSLVTGVL